MIGWLIALVYNAVGDFASALPGDFLARNTYEDTTANVLRPAGDAVPDARRRLIVHLDRFGGQDSAGSRQWMPSMLRDIVCRG